MCIYNMNTRHESFLSRDGSPRELNLLALVENVSTQQVFVQSSSNVCNTKPRSTMFQIRRRSKHNSNLKIHTLTEKIITEVKFTISSHAASAGTRFSTTQAVLRQQTNMGEGFTNDPTTHHYGVLHDPATHHTRRVILHDSNY